MDEKEWNEHLERSKTWNIMVGQDLLHSAAYKDLNYAPSLKTLNFFYEKIRLIRTKGKGKKGRNKFERINGGIIFLYEEAEFRGLTHKQFSRALEELYTHGFIDVEKPGSGRRGDCTKYAISNRWRDFGKADFKTLSFPHSFHWINFGFQKGGNKRKKGSPGKSQVEKPPLSLSGEIST